MLIKTRNNRNLLGRFIANRRGSVAIEFAIIALPFFLMIFSVFEVGLGYAAQQVMSNVTDDIARQLLTGELRKADVTATKLKNLICPRLLLPATGCPDLFVDLRTYADFKSVPLTLPLTATGDVNTSGFKSDPGAASTINQLRVFYRWPLITDIMRYRMDGIDGSGKTLLFSSATWRNEPYL